MTHSIAPAKSLLFLILIVMSVLSLNGFAESSTVIGQSLDSPDRQDVDRARDANRHPGEILAFFDISPGMTVLDLFSGGGFYTEIVSRIVGEEGRVLAHNNEAYLAFVKAEVKNRYRDGRLANVTQVTAEANDLELEAASVDAVLAILTWHDFYYVDTANSWPRIDAGGVVDTLCSAVRPDGVLGVVDHVAIAGSDPWKSGQDLHRIDPERIKADLAGSCFEFDGEISALRNPADDTAKSMSDPSIRGKTDRVVYRFRRRG